MNLPFPIFTPLFAILLATGIFAFAARWFQDREKKRRRSLKAQSLSNELLLHRLQKQRDYLKATNKKLLIREAELADAQRIAQIGSWQWYMESGASTASPEMCRIFGLGEIPPFAQQNGVMFEPDVWELLHQARVKAVRTGAGYSIEIPALHADGHEIWVNSRSEPIFDDRGNVVGLRGMVQDITERKRSESVAKNERFIRTITDVVPGLMAYYDRNLICGFANKPYLDWHQHDMESMLGKSLIDLVGTTLYEVNKPQIDAALAGQRQRFERHLTRADGVNAHVLAEYIPYVDDSGLVLGFVLLETDLKAIELAEAELKIAANVFANTSEGIMVTDGDGIILSVNPSFTTITGFTAHEAVGVTPRLLRSERHDADFYSSMWKQIGESGQWRGEIWNRRKNGEIFVEWLTITRIGEPDTSTCRYIAVFYDTTDTWHKNETVRHLAFHDALTGLPNRALLLERMDRQLVIAQRQPKLLAVLFLDLDGFKQVNDTFGHAIGDELLVVVANRLESLLRQADTVARLGGDEFVVLLDNPLNAKEVELIAQRIIAIIKDPIVAGNTIASVGTSIGIAMHPMDGRNASELIQCADTAMYVAKRTGKNTYHFGNRHQ